MVLMMAGLRRCLEAIEMSLGAHDQRASYDGGGGHTAAIEPVIGGEFEFLPGFGHWGRAPLR